MGGGSSKSRIHVGTGRYFSEEILVHINAMYSSTNFNSI
jgi:hypothetical protein